MKSLSVILSCLTLSAFSADPCCPPIPSPTPIPLTCCPETYNFCNLTVDVYGEFLYLQPNGSNLYYAVQAFPFDNAIATPIASPNWQAYEFSPSYQPAFEVGVKLLYPSTDMNIVASWERLRSEDSASKTVSSTEDMIGPIFDIGPNSAAYSSAKGHAKFDFDAANLLFGKRICFFNGLSANFYAGAAFLRIEQNIKSEYSNPAKNFTRTIEAPSKFIGGGTEFGFDFAYRLGCNFFFTGNSSISMLMGQLKNHTTYKSTSPEIAAIHNPEPNIQKTSVFGRSQLIPGFMEKMGFSYAAAFNSWKATLGLGYQFQIYLNAVQSFDMVSQVLPSLAPFTPDVGLFAVAFQRTLSNFILTGPYASLYIDF